MVFYGQGDTVAPLAKEKQLWLLKELDPNLPMLYTDEDKRYAPIQAAPAHAVQAASLERKE